MNLIVAVDKNWAIGYNNRLLARIPNDLKHFRNMTLGKVIVMGRKTLESFPGGQPLEKRVNIVLTTNPDFKAKGTVLLHSLSELDEELKKYDPGDVFVIGGGSIYQQLLARCDTAYVTKIDHSFQADTWFPNLDEDKEWEVVEESREHTCFDLEYRFMTYKRVNS